VAKHPMARFSPSPPGGLSDCSLGIDRRGVDQRHCAVFGFTSRHDLRAAEDPGLPGTRHKPGDHLAIGLPERRLGALLDEFLVGRLMHLGAVSVMPQPGLRALLRFTGRLPASTGDSDGERWGWQVLRALISRYKGNSSRALWRIGHQLELVSHSAKLW